MLDPVLVGLVSYSLYDKTQQSCSDVRINRRGVWRVHWWAFAKVFKKIYPEVRTGLPLQL